MVQLKQAVPFGVTSISLGRSGAGHSLATKIVAAGRAGCHTLEVSIECLKNYAKECAPGAVDEVESWRVAARAAAALARQEKVVLVVLDAFQLYDGLLDRQAHDARVEEFKVWLELASLMGIEIIQMPSSCLPKEQCTGDLNVLVKNLQEVADLAAACVPVITIAYEPLSWGTWIDSWEDGLALIDRADRPNLKLCLDTFHTISLLYGAPDIEGGLRPGGQEAYNRSIEALKSIPSSKIGLFQLSDCALFDPPLPESRFYDPTQHPCLTWSRNGRPYPGEGYCYDQVLAMARAVFSTGYRGYTLMEIFEPAHHTRDSSVPSVYADRGQASWDRVVADVGLAPRIVPPARHGLGTCTVSMGTRFHHDLVDKLYAAASVGVEAIDLFEDDFTKYLTDQPAVDKNDPYKPAPFHLAAAKRIGDLCASLGMRIDVLQPLIDIEGILNPQRRETAFKRVTSTFPFLRALRTDCVFITAWRTPDDEVTGDKEVVARDLAELGDLAAAFAKQDGLEMIRIGYESLSWAIYHNTWKSCWEVVKLANRPNAGLVFDTFNLLAVEYADPYNPKGHGRLYDTEEESLTALRASLSELARTVDPDKIFVVQVADAQLVDPAALPLDDGTFPRLLPWSRGHRLFPNEKENGGYMPVDEVLAAILSTGYLGSFTLEVFNNSLLEAGADVVPSHADRGIKGLRACYDDALQLAKARYP